MADAEIKKEFSGKKMTLMGLGLLGRGVGDAEFFAEAGADLIVTDLKSAADLAPSIERLKKFSNVTYHLGEHRMEDFENRDLVIRATNAPLDSPYLAHARESGIPIEMDASLFAKLSRASIVGITGTRGKSTVTHLIYAIAQAAGLNPVIGGNERGVATLQLVKTVNPGDLAILELDSWQLQGFTEDKISPHIGVWTNFMRDHMNYYKNDMGRYFEDKAAIARFQKSDDIFITTGALKAQFVEHFGAPAGTCVTGTALPADWKLLLPGEHNRANAALALAAARTLGVSDDVSRKVLENFNGLPGRLELLGTKDARGKHAITFYNDSNATVPEAVMAALKALAVPGKPIVLIAGGSDKELVFGELAQAIATTAKAAVLFTGAATEKLKPLLPKGFPATLVSTMEQAVMQALDVAQDGDIVLLSPGATSFGIFKNEYDRGDQFREIVAKLK